MTTKGTATRSDVQQALQVVTNACYGLGGHTRREQVEALIAIQKEADAILATTIATEAGRTFPGREAFARCLHFLALLTDSASWDFLRDG